jgi:hypothetical protein
MLNPPAISRCSESPCCYLLDMSIWLKTAKITTSVTQRPGTTFVKMRCGSSDIWDLPHPQCREPGLSGVFGGCTTGDHCYSIAVWDVFSGGMYGSHMVWKLPTDRGIQKSHGNFQSFFLLIPSYNFPPISIHISYRIVITLPSSHETWLENPLFRDAFFLLENLHFWPEIQVCPTGMVIKTLPRESCAAKSPGYHGIYWMNVKPYKIWMDMNGRSGKIVSWRLGYKQHVQWPVWHMVKEKITSQSSGGKKEAVSASSKPSWQEIGWSCCLGSKLVVKPCRWLYTCPDGYIPNIGCSDWIPEMVGYVKLNTQHELYVHDGWFCHYIMIGSVVACKCVAQC